MKRRKILILVIPLLIVLGFVSIHATFSFLHSGNPEFNPILRSKSKVVRFWVNDAWSKKLICYTAFENKLGEWKYYKFRSTLLDPKQWGWDLNFTFKKRRHRYFHKDDPRFDEMRSDPLHANLFALTIRSPEYTELLLKKVSEGIDEVEIKDGLLDGYIHHAYLKNGDKVIRHKSYNLNLHPEEKNLWDLFSLLSHIDFMLRNDSEIGYNKAVEKNSESLRAQNSSR